MEFHFEFGRVASCVLQLLRFLAEWARTDEIWVSRPGNPGGAGCYRYEIIGGTPEEWKMRAGGDKFWFPGLKRVPEHENFEGPSDVSLLAHAIF